MKLVVFLMAVAASSAATEGGSRRAVEGLERVGDRVWRTSTGVTVVCGGGRKRASHRPAPGVELQLVAVLDSVCRYLYSQTVVGDSDSSQQPQQNDTTDADTYQQVKYNSLFYVHIQI